MKRGLSFGTIVAFFGSILIALGFIWLIAQNWHQMSAFVKILILVAATFSSFGAGVVLRSRDYAGLGASLITLGSLLYTWSIFLIAQIYSTSTSVQGTAWLFLMSWAGVIVVSYLLKSGASLLVGMIEFLIWIILQYIAFGMDRYEFPDPGILAFYLLFIGTLSYGLYLIHNKKQKYFSNVYRWWTTFYFLLFSYLLTFQMLLPFFWPEETSINTPSLIFLLFLGNVSIGIFLLAIIQKKYNKKELYGMISIILLLSILIGLTAFADDKTSMSIFFSGSSGTSTINWFLWILNNVAFIGILLAFIGYGTWMKVPAIINIAIIFFGIDIITRYIGFAMDFWGYTSLSIIFITGGIILLVGGWYIEKWRRKLIQKAKANKRTKG